jgi:hypothetical protein
MNSGAYTMPKFSYMMVFSLPLIVGYRWLEKLRKKHIKGSAKPKTEFVALPKLINSLFIGLLNIEGSFQKVIDFPFGTSLIARVKKPI